MESEAGTSLRKTQRKYGSFLSFVTFFRLTISYDDSTFSQALWGNLLPYSTQSKELPLMLPPDQLIVLGQSKVHRAKFFFIPCMAHKCWKTSYNRGPNRTVPCEGSDGDYSYFISGSDPYQLSETLKIMQQVSDKAGTEPHCPHHQSPRTNYFHVFHLFYNARQILIPNTVEETDLGQQNVQPTLSSEHH